MVASASLDESPPVVRFNGTWSDREKTLVEQAVSEAETVELPSYEQLRTSPWVATYHDCGETDLYAASRIGVSRVLSSASASDLAEQIRQFARSEASSDGSSGSSAGS